MSELTFRLDGPATAETIERAKRLAGIYCNHCKQSVPPDRTGPSAISGDMFISCPACDHDIYSGESFESWTSRPVLNSSDDDNECWMEADITEQEIGEKHDQGKAQWDLTPWAAQTEITKALTFGAEKYGPDNWRNVGNAKRRYTSALFRHVVAWLKGDERDPESGLHHLAHAGCCLLFLLEVQLEKSRE